MGVQIFIGVRSAGLPMAAHVSLMAVSELLVMAGSGQAASEREQANADIARLGTHQHGVAPHLATTFSRIGTSNFNIPDVGIALPIG